jgi:mono/diheme cytochrome c family protein
MALACAAALALACGPAVAQSGHVLDEAQTVGRTAASFPHAQEDYFHDMDGGLALNAAQIRGRNMWNVWTGGDDRFWDGMTNTTFGAFDLLKIVTSHPGEKSDRDSRWSYLGVVNEPCFDKPTGPDPARFGLWLDKRSAGCPPDPFENEQKYPGVAIGARGKTVPVGSFYGYASGILGLRLFPNPAFDEAAKKAWDPERYYTDPSYYNRKDLVRPYRVGMSCGFCHIGPSPTNPPADPAHPDWKNLSSTVGAQYMWVDRIFIYSASQDNFMYQLVHTYRPGSMDTSLISTDNINNPRTMNAIYNLDARMGQALRWGKETLADGQRNNKQLNDYVKTGDLTAFYKPPVTVWTPRVLKDGSDSVGVLGALNRVYLNIGLFSEEWLLHFNPVVGGKPISPIQIAVAERNSSYWRATEAGTFDMAQFFLTAGRPDHLKNAPGGAKYLTEDAATVDRGKLVFAETCARCHSSKQPPKAAGLDPGGCSGPGYMTCWNKYWASTKTADYKAQMRAIVQAPDFLDGNYLSAEFRVPVTLLQTNACSPLATNAIAGNIWDNFSSQTYKTLPSVGSVTIYDPFTGAPSSYTLPGGGRGFTRPPSLVSVWSSAPYLLNNSVGPFNGDPSVDGRMKTFQASIEQMLWPEKRDKDAVLGDKIPGVIDRTTARSYVRIPAGFQPDFLKPLRTALHRISPDYVDAAGDITLGPIPAGVPVDLLANLRPLPESDSPLAIAAQGVQLAKLLLRLATNLATLPKDATDEQLRAKFADLVGPMMALSKCKDFVVNRGHYFGTSMFKEEPALSDSDKQALIAFLKTF